MDIVIRRKPNGKFNIKIPLDNGGSFWIVDSTDTGAALAEFDTFDDVMETIAAYKQTLLVHW